MIFLDMEFLVPDITVDLEDFNPGLSDQEWNNKLAVIVPLIARETIDFWHSEAGRRLKTSRQAYQDAIVLEGTTDTGFIISLKDDEFLPSAVEFGVSSFDMKPGLQGKIVPLNNTKGILPTFRKVSPNNVKSWIHPGIVARNIHEDVIEELEEVIIPKYLNELI